MITFKFDYCFLARVLIVHFLGVVRLDQLVVVAMCEEGGNVAFIQVLDWLQLVDIEFCFLLY